MLTALLLTVLALASGPVELAQAPADGQAPYLEAVPSAPEGCRVMANNDHVVIDCAGTALVVAAGDGTRSGLHRLMDEQVAPFAMAGLPVTDVSEVACRLKGVAGRCLERTVSVPGADSMSLLGGLAADGSYAAICLRRGQGVGDPCQGVLALEG